LAFVIAEPTLSKGVVRRCAAVESSTELCGCIRCLGNLKTVARMAGWESCKTLNIISAWLGYVLFGSSLLTFRMGSMK